MRICLMSIAPAFSLGYPKINAAFEGQWNNRAIHFEAEGVLKHELGHAGGRLRIIILHVASIELLPHLDVVNVLNNFLPRYQSHYRIASNSHSRVCRSKTF
jgi:hypothetical protein